MSQAEEIEARRAPMSSRVHWRGFASFAEPGRVALWSPVALGLGALIYFQLDEEPVPLTGHLAFAIGVVALIFASRLRPRVVVAAVALTAIGFGLAVVRAQLVATPVVQSPTPIGEFRGQVVDAYGHQDGRPRVVLMPSEVRGLEQGQLPARIRIALRKGDERPTPGSWIGFDGRLTPLPGPVAPGAYDFARNAYFDGIGAYGFATTRARPATAEGDGSLWMRVVTFVAAVRQDASIRIQQALPGATGAIAAALTVGDRSAIPENVDADLRDSSLAHILSISGLHMAIVGLSVFAAIRFAAALVPAIALRYQVKKWAALAALMAAAVYLALSGGSVPAQRSFIMIGLMFVAVMADRAPFTLRIVAISALIVLAIAPESVVDPSFQMSFAAVTALVASFEAFEAYQARRGGPLVLRDTIRGRIAYALLAAVIASLVAGLATSPFAAFHFNRVAVYGVIANVAAMPVTTFVVMPFAALSMALMPLGLEYGPLQVMGWGIDALLWIARETAALPGSAGTVPTMPAWALGLITIGGLWVLLWRGGVRLLGAAPVVAGLVAAAFPAQPILVVDREAANVAIRADDGRLAVVSGRRARFAAEEWLQRDGDAGDLRSAARRGREGVWSCSDGLCVATERGLRVVYMERAGDARAACSLQAAITVAQRVIAPCADGLTITPRETGRNGAYAVYLGPEGLRVETVRDHTGARPWTVWPVQ